MTCGVLGRTRRVDKLSLEPSPAVLGHSEHLGDSRTPPVATASQPEPRATSANALRVMVGKTATSTRNKPRLKRNDRIVRAFHTPSWAARGVGDLPVPTMSRAV